MQLSRQTQRRLQFTLAVVFLLCFCWVQQSHCEDRFTTKYDWDIQRSVARYWPRGIRWEWWKAQLYQESLLNTDAVSPVGAAGLAQFMPATWRDVTSRMGIHGASPHEAKYAIQCGAYYMRTLWNGWSSPRPWMDRLKLAQASYNAGTGNILKAQRACENKSLYTEIIACLPQITGVHSKETITYTIRIERWYEEMVR